MNRNTKKILILSILLCSLALGACIILFFQIKNAGAKLNNYTVALSEKNTREEAFIKVNRLIQDSTEKRATLATAFFTDEGNSVSFLNDLEKFASTINLNIKTSDLNRVQNEDKKSESITMTFVYSGQKDKVLTFTKFLEETPYHSSITGFEFKQVGPSIWEGKLTLLISLIPK